MLVLVRAPAVLIVCGLLPPLLGAPCLPVECLAGATSRAPLSLLRVGVQKARCRTTGAPRRRSVARRDAHFTVDRNHKKNPLHTTFLFLCFVVAELVGGLAPL